MKVDITLTVGGNDVTIDYSEGKKLFLTLRDLYDPSARESQAYSVFDSEHGNSGSTCSKKKNKPEVEISEKTETAIKKIKDTPGPDFIDPDIIDEAIMNDPDIDTTTVDSEIAKRMKQMQNLINDMNQQ